MFGKRYGTKVFTGLVFVLCLLVVMGVTSLASAAGWQELQNAVNGDAASSAWDTYFTVSDNSTTGVRTITLKQDIVCTNQSLEAISIEKGNTVIDLNGYAIDRGLTAAISKGSVIWVAKNASLTIRDGSASKSGKITGGMTTSTYYDTKPGCAGGISVYYGTLKLEGGTVYNNSTKKTGGGVYVYAGKVEMSGNASISGNTATNYAGGIEVNGGSSLLIKDNSKITGNKAKYGGGTDIDGSSTIVMQDYAAITNNEATSSGGGIFLEGSATVTLKGNAAITGNKAGTSGGGIRYIGSTKLVVGGSAKVTGNTVSGASDNVSINTGKVITVATGDNEPTSEMLIGVTTTAVPAVGSPVNLTGSNSKDYSSCFTSDKTPYAAANDANIVKLMHPATITNATPEADKNTNHGYITIDKSSAVAGETVTVTVYPNDSYELDTLVYTDSANHDLSTTSFNMPDANVSVKATFKKSTVATPVASPAADIYITPQSVELTTTTVGADIYYTTDGSDPTTGSTKYTGAITVDSTQTIKAIAVKANWIDSAVLTANYTITGTVATPVASPAAGIYITPQSVELTTTTDGADIYYTTDGSVPTTGSTKYTSAITVDSTQTIKAIAGKANWADSAVLTAAYTITGTVATPVASPAAGIYTTAQSVELTTTTDGADIYYTTDGSDPTTASAKYTGAITVDSTQTIKAIAVKANWIDSAVLTADYTIAVPVVKVEADPNTASLKPGESLKITAKITPENASDKNLTVSMDQEGIVKVSEDGTVTALQAGTVKLTYTASNGVSGSCVITVKADPINYMIIQGANQEIQENADSALFRSNADYSKFLHVEVDGKKLTADDFESYSGSTVIVLKASFIKKLGLGVHTLRVVSNDGFAATKFTIHALPDTGDKTPVALLILSLVVTLGTIVYITAKQRKYH